MAVSDDGSFVYTPAENFSGEDAFTYRAGDGSAFSAPATVTITVNRDPGISVTPTSGLVTTEAGGAASDGSLLDSVTTSPPAGAGAVSDTRLPVVVRLP